ncbi:unnamed protein product [Rhizoctonia solani]|uniref:Uncharacterized protein n=1 Tax=Rhizoctonia solani TaxID=456999 RepID=A0A8H3G5G2_9AGAM|nr:unnamed protein product [Rhizoctonia solani]
MMNSNKPTVNLTQADNVLNAFATLQIDSVNNTSTDGASAGPQATGPQHDSSIHAVTHGRDVAQLDPKISSFNYQRRIAAEYQAALEALGRKAAQPDPNTSNLNYQHRVTAEYQADPEALADNSPCPFCAERHEANGLNYGMWSPDEKWYSGRC